MAVVSVVAVIVVVTPVWAAMFIDIVEILEFLVIGVSADADIVVADVIVIALEFVFPAPYPLDVPFDVTSDLFMEALTLDVPPGVGVEVLAGTNVNAFAGAMAALKLPVPTTLEDLSR